MNSLACLFAVISVVACMPQEPAQAPSRQIRQELAQGAQPNSAAAVAPAGQAGPAQPAQPALGPQFFGPGLNNQFALPPNQQQIGVAQQVISANPNVRVFVGVDGQIEFTDQFGREVEVVDTFGRDPLEFVSPQEQFERAQELRELQLEQAQRQAKLQAQQNLLRQFTSGTAAGVGAGANPAFLGADLEHLEELSELQALRNFQQQQGAQPNAGANNFAFQ